MFGVVWDYCSCKVKGKQYKQNTRPKSYKAEIKIINNLPGFALSGFEQPGPADQCTNLVLCRIQDTGVRQIVEGPSGAKIKELNLTNCVRVSDVTLLRIAQRWDQHCYGCIALNNCSG